MALLSRLFSYRKNQQPQNNPTTDNDRSSFKSFSFSKAQVRVLLFRECDWRGRKLLFDSNAVQKVSLENSTCKLRFTSRPKKDQIKKDAFVEVTSGYGYQYTKPSADATLLGEMMFGAVAMTFRGTALKVHALPNPNRLMCTKVFPSPEVAHPNRRISDKSLEDSFGSSINSMSDYFSRSESEQLLESGGLDVPGVEVEGVYSSVAGDSGFCGDFSLQSISSTGSSYWTPVASSADARHSYGSLQGGSGKQSGGSLTSLQRRWLRSVTTSLELGQNDEVLGCGAHHRRTKLGLTVLVTLTDEQHREMEIYLFEHMSIIETMIERLRHSVERAYLRKDMFVHLMYEGWSDMQESLHDMLCAPRHACPMWLNLGLTNAESKTRASLAATFVHDLCQLISTFDTKATNFFVSTLVTGVLTHHLGWVNTVLASSSVNPTSAMDNETNVSLNELTKSHPYNPLWAQLGDLYGALGSPTKIAKTIITCNSRKTDCVNKLLTAVTYFIRCGEVKESTNLVCNEMTSLADHALFTSGETLSSSKCYGRGNASDLLTEDGIDLNVTHNSSTVTLKESNVGEKQTGNVLRRDVKLETETSGDSCFQLSQSNSFTKDFKNRPDSSSGTLTTSVSCAAADKPNLTNTQKTEHFEIKLPSFISYLDDLSESRSPCPLISLTDPGNDKNLLGTSVKQRDIYVEERSPVESSGASVNNLDRRKNQNNELENANCETGHLKRGKTLESHNLKASTFCSSAGAEWKNEEYVNSFTNNEINRVKRDTMVDTGRGLRVFDSSRCAGNKCEEKEEEQSREKLLSQSDSVSRCESESQTSLKVDIVDNHEIAHVQRKRSNGVNFYTSFQAASPSYAIVDKSVTAEELDLHDGQRNHSGLSNDSVFDQQNQTCLDCAEEGSNEDSRLGFEGVSRHNPAFGVQLDNGCLTKSGANGLRSMKRTSSCRTKLSDLSGKRYGLYPNIDELAKMENVCLDEFDQRDSKAVPVVLDVVKPDDLSTDVINDKVTKLCRVPTSSILFHLRPKEEEQEFSVQPMECFDSKRFESERQMATCDSPKLRRAKNLSVKSCHGIVERVKENEVVFVLGDNEELKGIKHRSTSSLAPEKLLNSVASNIQTKCSSDNNLKVNLSTSQYGMSDEDNTFNLSDVSDAKVVTVKASLIDMEAESGLLRTDVGDQSYLKPYENKCELGTFTVSPLKPISRSCSVNLPLASSKCIKQISKVVRRHTDTFCDKCKTILKEKLVSKKLNESPSGSCDANKAFLSCEKCYYNNQKHNSEGLGHFRRTKSEKIGLNLIDNNIDNSHERLSSDFDDTTACGNSVDYSSSDNAETEPPVSSEVSQPEKSAIYEQYNSSDDEVLCPRSLKHVAKVTGCTEKLCFEDLHVTELPLPRCPSKSQGVVGLAGSLLGGVSNRYVPDLVLQGCSLLPIGWEATLRRDLALVAKLPLLGQDVAEAVCIVANTSTWEVQLVSSHAYVVDKPGTFGVRVGMSQLVANMLESLVHLWQLKVSPEQCLAHLESKLKELHLRSQALAELLLTTEFCNMELLTTSLELEANDVPLLLAIASTHSPHIANRYGLSFV